MSRAAFVLPILFLFAAPALSAHAADLIITHLVHVPAGETIRDDFYAGGDNVTVDGTVEGDLFAVGQNVRIHGRVTGSVFALAENLVVAGTVDGDVRALARTIYVSGPIGGDALVGGASTQITPTGRVGRDLGVAGGVVKLEGPIERTLRGFGSDLRVNGRVGGNADLWGVDQLTLGAGARIAGNVGFESHNDAIRDPSAEVRGQINRRDPPSEPGSDPKDRLSGGLFTIFAVSLLGAVALIISPRGTLAAGTASVEQAIPSLAWGFGLLVGIPVAAVLLLITVVGIPLALMAILTYGMLLYSSQAIVALGIGRFLLARLRPIEGYGWSVLSVLIGAVIVAAARSVPYLEAIASVIIILLGLGGMGLAFVQSRSSTAAKAGGTPR